MKATIQEDLFQDPLENENLVLEILKNCSKVQIETMWGEFDLREKPKVPNITIFDREHYGQSAGYFCFRENPIKIEMCKDQKPKNGEDNLLTMIYNLSHEISHYLHYSVLGRKEFIKFYSRQNIREILRLTSSQGWCELIANHATFNYFEKIGDRNRHEEYSRPIHIPGELSRRHFNASYNLYLQNSNAWKKMLRTSREELNELLTEDFSEEFFTESIIRYLRRAA